MMTTYTNDWATALGVDIATLERARAVAVKAAEAIYHSDTTDASKAMIIVGYCDDLDEVLADVLGLADVQYSGLCHRLFSVV